MNTNQLSSPARHQAPQGVNPFARALAEAKGSQGQSQSDSVSPSGSMLTESSTPDPWAEQRLMEEQREKQKQNALHQKLHREINPVEMHDVFVAQEQQVANQIKEIKHELKLLDAEIKGFDKEVELTLETNVVSPSQGKYYFTFFQKLKEFIILLRQRVHSARTWAQQAQKKKSRKIQAGMEIGGKSYEQTSTIQDMMTNSERNTAYAGS
jgi:hypothetical protein